MYINEEDMTNDVEDTEEDLETPTSENLFSSMQVMSNDLSKICCTYTYSVYLASL